MKIVYNRGEEGSRSLCSVICTRRGNGETQVYSGIKCLRQEENMKNKSSGVPGIVVAVGLVILFLFSRRFFPSLSTILLVGFGIILALVVLIVVLVIYFSRKKPDNKDGSQPAENVNAILSKGRANLMELRRLGMRIKNPEVRGLGEEICRIIDRILRTLKDQPEDITRVRRFFNYYLPTLGNILLKYVRVEESGISAPEMTESTVACLRDIRTAMEKQYQNLFEDDILDLSVEMETLTRICRRDGLLSDEELKNGDSKINLIL